MISLTDLLFWLKGECRQLLSLFFIEIHAGRKYLLYLTCDYDIIDRRFKKLNVVSCSSFFAPRDQLLPALIGVEWRKTRRAFRVLSGKRRPCAWAGGDVFSVCNVLHFNRPCHAGLAYCWPIAVLFYTMYHAVNLEKIKKSRSGSPGVWPPHHFHVLSGFLLSVHYL